MKINKMVRVQPDGSETIWYSEEYVKQQLDDAFRAGLYRGGRVQLLSVQPMSGYMVDDLTDEFKKRIDEEYKNVMAERVERSLRSIKFNESLNNPTYEYNHYKPKENNIDDRDNHHVVII